MVVFIALIFIIMFAVLIYLLVNETPSIQEDQRKAQKELNEKLDRLAEKQRQTNQAVAEIKKQVEKPEVVEATVVKTPPVFYDPPKQAASKPQPKPAPTPNPASQPKPKQQAQPKPKPQPKKSESPKQFEQIEQIVVQETLFPQFLEKGDDAINILDRYNVYYIDRRFDSGIIWVPKDTEVQKPLEIIKELYTVKYESRGAVITGGYPAWRIMVR